MAFQYGTGNVVFERVNLSADFDSRIALVLFKLKITRHDTHLCGGYNHNHIHSTFLSLPGQLSLKLIRFYNGSLLS